MEEKRQASCLDHFSLKLRMAVIIIKVLTSLQCVYMYTDHLYPGMFLLLAPHVVHTVYVICTYRCSIN